MRASPDVDASPERCSCCGRRTPLLASNRPLHRGARPTLLVCRDCARSADDALFEAGHCAWCGAAAAVFRPAAGAHALCARCAATTVELLGNR